MPLLHDCFRANNRLLSLDVSYCRLSSEALASVLSELHRSFSLVRFEFVQAKQAPRKDEKAPLSASEEQQQRAAHVLAKNAQLLHNRGHNQRSAVEALMHAAHQQFTAFDFSHTPLASLPATVALLHHHLVELALFDCSLVDISALLGAATPFRLKRLILRKNRLAAIPEAIDRLAHLEFLDLADNQLSALPEQFGALSAMGYLDLSTNQFAMLPLPVARMGRLQVLYLRDNQIQGFPVQFVALRAALLDLDLEDNPLVTVPAAVLRGKKRFVTPSSLRRLFEYLATLSSSGQAHSQRVKLMFVGDENQGKTSLMNALKQSFFSGLVSSLFSSGSPTSTVATDGIEISQMQADDITFCCWYVLLFYSYFFIIILFLFFLYIFVSFLLIFLFLFCIISYL